MTTARIIRRTKSLCPVCGAPVGAVLAEREGSVFLTKNCPEHGPSSALVLRDASRLAFFSDGSPEPAPRELDFDITAPQNATCCVVAEVTRRCNLSCPHCFADAGGADGADPTIDELRETFAGVASRGESLVQISGGEPTVRDDLPGVIRAAREAGVSYVQLNTNGLRAAADPAFARELASAGVSFAFMQFDGLDDHVYIKLRGRPMMAEKERAIENFAAAGVGVTLVPAIARGVNDDQVGALIKYAAARSPDVRGIHFQPMAHLGRRPSGEPPTDGERFTIDDLLTAIERQTGGAVSARSLLPSKCDHPLCGIHGDFIALPGGRLEPITSNDGGDCCCCASDEERARRNRRFVARRWQRPEAALLKRDIGDLSDMDDFLGAIASRGFTITAMAFQDRWNIDLARIARCSLHVTSGGKLTPFCIYYNYVSDRDENGFTRSEAAELRRRAAEMDAGCGVEHEAIEI